MNKSMQTINHAVQQAREGQLKYKRIGTLYRVEVHDEMVDVIYRGTTVARFEGQTVTLWDRGWQTVTTKAVMNAALMYHTRYRLFQKKYEWYVDTSDPGALPLPFKDGMILTSL